MIIFSSAQDPAIYVDANVTIDACEHVLVSPIPSVHWWLLKHFTALKKSFSGRDNYVDKLFQHARALQSAAYLDDSPQSALESLIRRRSELSGVKGVTISDAAIKDELFLLILGVRRSYANDQNYTASNSVTGC